MLNINIQLFAHKKGMGSTKNGETAKLSALVLSVLTVSLFLPATFSFAREVHISIRATMLAVALMILSSLLLTVRLNLSV